MNQHAHRSTAQQLQNNNRGTCTEIKINLHIETAEA